MDEWLDCVLKFLKKFWRILSNKSIYKKNKQVSVQLRIKFEGISIKYENSFP